MTALVWGVKSSLREYVRSMADGRTECLDGAESTAHGFRFPSDGTELVFRGEVRLIGHGGMMRVVLRDPALERRGQSWVLTITDPDDPEQRLPFAHIAAFEAVEGGRRATDTSLTEEGADLFFGPYRDGTLLDRPYLEE